MARDRELRQQELAGLMLQKALKAALPRLGVDYDLTHDLASLYEQAEISALHPPESLDAVDTLTLFAVRFRYTLFEGPAAFDRIASAKLPRRLSLGHMLLSKRLSPSDTQE
jgi:HEPN domain-containing protein